MATPDWRLASIVLLALFSGCGGHGQFSSWVVRGEHFSFRTGALPRKWRRVDGNANAQFFRADLGAVIMANAECKKLRDSPLPVLANTLLFGFTDLHYQLQRTIPFDGREALHSIAEAKLDGVAMSIESYVLKKDGCVYDLDYAAPPVHFRHGRADFGHFVAGFATLRT